MQTRKSICKRLLEPSYVSSFVDDPLSRVSSIKANQTVNSRKAAVISVGREVMKTDEEAAKAVNAAAKAPKAGSKRRQKSDHFSTGSPTKKYR